MKLNCIYVGKNRTRVEIKACPFCGKRGELKEELKTPQPLYWIQCANQFCLARVGVSVLRPRNAVNKWNKRS